MTQSGSWAAMQGDDSFPNKRWLLNMIQILGDYQGFFAMQTARLAQRNMDISGCRVSHLAYRTETYDNYLALRDRIEEHCSANIENVWNGRPISKMLLNSPLDLGDGFEVSLIELIPPIHQRLYKMGLEHVGIVIGDSVDEFARVHRSNLTGQQFQAPLCEPYYVLFDEDYTHVKFYRESLMDVCIKEGQTFDRFSHVSNWTA
jgi:predicted metalloenzyme YecM